MKRRRRLPVDLSTQMDHQLTRMVTRKEDHRKHASLADDELQSDRQLAADPLRPLVLVLLEQARLELEREARDEGNLSRPACKESQ